MINPVLQQKTFRGRGDTVGLNVNTFDHALNADWSQATDIVFRARFVIQETAGAAADVTFSIYYSHNGGGYTLLNGATPAQWATSSQYANDSGTTAILATGTGTFVAGVGASGGNVMPSEGTIGFDASGYTELEVAMRIDGAQVADGDTFAFRIHRSNGEPLGTYTVTPVVTTVKAAPDPVTYDASGGSAVTVSEAGAGGMLASASGGDSVTVSEAGAAEVVEPSGEAIDAAGADTATVSESGTATVGEPEPETLDATGASAVTTSQAGSADVITGSSPASTIDAAGADGVTTNQTGTASAVLNGSGASGAIASQSETPERPEVEPARSRTLRIDQRGRVVNAEAQARASPTHADRTIRVPAPGRTTRAGGD